MRRTTETINPRIVALAGAAAATADWIERSTAAIPLLAGVSLEVVSADTVAVIQEGRQIAGCRLTEDDASFAIVVDDNVIFEGAETQAECVTRIVFWRHDNPPDTTDTTDETAQEGTADEPTE